MALRLGALDKVSLEADEKTELEREKQVSATDRPAVRKDDGSFGGSPPCIATAAAYHRRWPGRREYVAAAREV